MATILQFKSRAETRKTRIMYEALDLACTQLGAAGRPNNVRKTIAQRMLKAIEMGERDPARLCNIGLAAYGLDASIEDPPKQGLASSDNPAFPAA